MPKNCEIRRRAIASSVAIDGKIIDLLAPLRRTLDTSERAAHGVDFGAVIGEAVLHLHVDRPAQRVEAEGGIVGHHGDRSDRGGRNQVPVDGVAERFVDAHAVLVHREPLRRAGDGGCDEAAKLHVGLEGIAGNFIDDDARHVFLQRIADVQRSRLLDLIGVDDVDAGRHLVGINASARYRAWSGRPRAWVWRARCAWRFRSGRAFRRRPVRSTTTGGNSWRRRAQFGHEHASFPGNRHSDIATINRNRAPTCLLRFRFGCSYPISGNARGSADDRHREI